MFPAVSRAQRKAVVTAPCVAVTVNGLAAVQAANAAAAGAGVLR